MSVRPHMQHKRRSANISDPVRCLHVQEVIAGIGENDAVVPIHTNDRASIRVNWADRWGDTHNQIVYAAAIGDVAHQDSLCYGLGHCGADKYGGGNSWGHIINQC